MATGTYGSTAAPTDALGYLVQAESRIRMGTSSLYGSLETTSWTYTTYEASIGLSVGNSLDLGQVESLGFTHNPTFEPLESANVQQPSIYTLTGEETSLTVGVRQFMPEVLRVALGTAVSYELGNEVLMTFGGACTQTSRPVEIGITNIACNVPETQDVSQGINAIILTLYDCQVTGGLNWDNIVANEINSFELEMAAKPVLERAQGNRLGNLYIF